MSRGEEDRIERELNKVSASNDPFAAAVRTTRMPMLITDPNQPDNPIVFANDAFTRLTGYERSDVVGRNCRFLQGSGTNADDVTKIRNSIARCEPIEIDLLNYRKDGSNFWNRVLISPVFSNGGDLTYFFASQFDVTPERRRMAELHLSHGELEEQIEKRTLDLTASENRLRFILQSAKMGIWMLDIETQRMMCSAQCKDHYGRSKEETFTYQDLQASIDPVDAHVWQSAVERTIATGADLHVEYRIRTPSGETRWIEVRGQFTSRLAGEPMALMGVTQDITERKEAEEHRKLLARELNHRVKNSLATVQSIVTRTFASSSSLDEAKNTVFGRIGAMAGAQDVLTMAGWSSADLRSVISEALKPFKDANIRIGGPRVVLNEHAVSALSLAIYELATNASRYGALSTPDGSVTIHWEIERERPRVLKFYWSEMGGPPVSAPGRRGFGSRLIEDVVATAMHGKAKISFRPTGVLYELEAIIPDHPAG